MRNPNNNLIPNLWTSQDIEAARVWRGKCELRGLGCYFGANKIDPSAGWNTQAESYFFVDCMKRYESALEG